MQQKVIVIMYLFVFVFFNERCNLAAPLCVGLVWLFCSNRDLTVTPCTVLLLTQAGSAISKSFKPCVLQLCVQVCVFV